LDKFKNNRASILNTLKMKYVKFISLMIILSVLTVRSDAQNKVGINTTTPSATLDVNGNIRLGNDNGNVPLPGTMRFDSVQGGFQGWDGEAWRDFVLDPRETFWPSNGNRGSIGLFDPRSPDDATQGDQFGFSVAMDGGVAAVGSPGWMGNRGRVFLFHWVTIPGFWDLVDTVYSPEPSHQSEKFGFSISLSGNKLIVGAPEYFDGTINQFVGRAYLYNRGANNWNYEATIASAACYGLNFGFDVKISGNQGLISSPTAYTNPACPPPVNVNKGIVSYFNLSNGYFPISDLSNGVNGFSGLEKYGYSIDMHGKWAVIGAPFSQNSGTREDSLYIFEQDATLPFVWYHRQSFVGNSFDSEFARSVSIRGNRIFAGEPKYDVDPNDNKGALRIFTLNPSTQVWEENLPFKPGEDANGEYGHAVSLAAGFGISSAKSDPVDYGVYIQAYDDRVRNHARITDPLATSFDHTLHDAAVSGRNFIIGFPQGQSDNGQTGGRVFFGRIY
jgi:hypothetical protein